MKTLASALVLALLLGCSQKPTGPVDFITLVGEAFPAGGRRNDAKAEELWLEVNKLTQWHFASTRDLVGIKQPSLELVAGETWLVASTDLLLARAYGIKRGQALAPADASTELAKPNPYLADDGSPVVVTMTPDEAVKYLEGYSGPPLAGVRFNEGATRIFFGDVKAVVNIRKKLKEKGRLGSP